MPTHPDVQKTHIYTKNCSCASNESNKNVGILLQLFYFTSLFIKSHVAKLSSFQRRTTRPIINLFCSGITVTVVVYR